MKRFLLILLSLALIAPLHTIVSAASDHKVIVTAEEAAIYESSSIKSEKLITVKKDYVLTAIGSTKSFWKVQFKKKNDETIYVGYVLKKDIEEASTPIKSDEATNQSTSQPTTKSSSSTTTKSPSNSSVSKTLSTVYWTPNGDVYHSIYNCRSLARSKTIRSGTIAQSGKYQACKNCVR